MVRRSVAIAAALAGIGSVAGIAFASGGPLALGPASMKPQATYQAFYDGHKDTYLVTDVSNKAQASALHINYSAELAMVKGAPAQYFIKGPATAGQLSVFGSEPGESDYNPLWEEFLVTWKAAKPVLLVRDDQIKALAKKHKLTLVDAHIVLNAPIIKVNK